MSGADRPCACLVAFRRIPSRPRLEGGTGAVRIFRPRRPAGRPARYAQTPCLQGLSRRHVPTVRSHAALVGAREQWPFRRLQQVPWNHVRPLVQAVSSGPPCTSSASRSTQASPRAANPAWQAAPRPTPPRLPGRDPAPSPVAGNWLVDFHFGTHQQASATPRTAPAGDKVHGKGSRTEHTVSAGSAAASPAGVTAHLAAKGLRWQRG
jgi:hypothetical protein